jgi:hypothetical protein
VSKGTYRKVETVSPIPLLGWWLTLSCGHRVFKDWKPEVHRHRQTQKTARCLQCEIEEARRPSQVPGATIDEGVRWFKSGPWVVETSPGVWASGTETGPDQGNPLEKPE